eukprot:CAMPEP_0196586100 /NCGR_PEP_ID=MMETSP1081-20130531/53124_1 /TAXON_ID=36882 /ORGANISM="Pyramimonas amylifera, Strain CCMP720" /LENGTH=93 /DNA_ID=CAMNT_0041907863 /DNA_START=304 /DNA_END=582 /DNA_ORIENTATION=+
MPEDLDAKQLPLELTRNGTQVIVRLCGQKGCKREATFDSPFCIIHNGGVWKSYGCVGKDKTRQHDVGIALNEKGEACFVFENSENKLESWKVG